MYAQIEKTKENKSRAVANSVTQKKSNGKQGFGFIDNRSEEVAQREISGVADSSSSRQTLIQKKEKPFGVAQLKKKGKVTDDYIQNLLKDIGNEELQKQLKFAWELIQANGEAYFDDEITKSFGVYDPKEEKLVFRIPEQDFFQWKDTTIEKKGIAIHELTHIAEIVANTGGLNNMDYDMNTPEIMGTDYLMAEKAINAVYEVAEKEKGMLCKIEFSSSSSHNKTLFGYITERIAYAGMALQRKKSNFEFPTVVNQLIYVLDKKGNDEVKKSETYSWLKILENQLLDSRTRRFMKNAK